MYHRCGMNAENRNKAGEAALLDRAGKDVENRRPGSQKQGQGSADKQPDIAEGWHDNRPAPVFLNRRAGASLEPALVTRKSGRYSHKQTLLS
ncbi:hypothetical protein GCM10007919_04200 [Rhizobium indigoferae]|nr:hypothetical protein GCM10007919_04200 [Rhizobium indigoferae]